MLLAWLLLFVVVVVVVVVVIVVVVDVVVVVVVVFIVVVVVVAVVCSNLLLLLSIKFSFQFTLLHGPSIKKATCSFALFTYSFRPVIKFPGDKFKQL